MRDPLGQVYEHYALVRGSAGRENSGLRECMEETLAAAIEEGLVLDAVLAESEQQARDFWRIREGIVEGQIPEGGSIKHDVSVPVSKVAVFIDRADKAVAKAIPGCRPCAFGHAGDGNIHYNVTQPLDMDKQEYLGKWKELNHVVHEIVLDLGGSISAEHGIGQLKRDELAQVKSPVEMDLMRKIKNVLDPGNLMNPGKVV